MKPVTVIKIGGGLVPALSPVWEQIAGLQDTRAVVVVHGGGPQATAMARRLGHEPVIVHGRRVTSDLDLDIVKWTLRGEINLALAAGAQAAGLRAVGLSGADAGLLRVRRRPPWDVDGQAVDFGWVGDVIGIDTRYLRVTLEQGVLPIVAPLGIDAEGQVYNVNADTVAVAIASELKAAELLLVTDAGCVLRGTTRLAECDRALFDQGVAQGWIQAGMRVKIQLGLEALEAGVREVWVTGPEDIVRRRASTRIRAAAASAKGA